MSLTNKIHIVLWIGYFNVFLNAVASLAGITWLVIVESCWTVLFIRLDESNGPKHHLRLWRFLAADVTQSLSTQIQSTSTIEQYGPTSSPPTSFTEYGSGIMHLSISQDLLSVCHPGLQLSFKLENSCEDSCVVVEENDDEDDKGENLGRGGLASSQ